jgi:hypothetical protein
MRIERFKSYPTPALSPNFHTPFSSAGWELNQSGSDPHWFYSGIKTYYQAERNCFVLQMII